MAFQEDEDALVAGERSSANTGAAEAEAVSAVKDTAAGGERAAGGTVVNKAGVKRKRLIVVSGVVLACFVALLLFAMSGTGQQSGRATGGERARSQQGAANQGNQGEMLNASALSELNRELGDGGGNQAGGDSNSNTRQTRFNEDYFPNRTGDDQTGDGVASGRREGASGSEGNSNGSGSGGLAGQVGVQPRSGGEGDNSNTRSQGSSTSGAISNTTSVRYAPVVARGAAAAAASGDGASASSGRREGGVAARPQTEVIPPFGTRLPVRVAGSFFAPSSSDAVVMMSLMTDVRGDGWSLPRDTMLVGRIKGVVANRRVEVAVFGYVNPENNRLVRIGGDALSDDGGTGFKGRVRNQQSILSRFGRGALSVASNVGAGLAGGYLYRSAVPVFLPGAYGGGGYGSGGYQPDQMFVEVEAGTSGFVLVKTLPGEVETRDAQPGSDEPVGAGEMELLRQIRAARDAGGRP